MPRHAPAASFICSNCGKKFHGLTPCDQTPAAKRAAKRAAKLAESGRLPNGRFDIEGQLRRQLAELERCITGLAAVIDQAVHQNEILVNHERLSAPHLAGVREVLELNRAHYARLSAQYRERAKCAFTIK